MLAASTTDRIVTARSAARWRWSLLAVVGLGLTLRLIYLFAFRSGRELPGGFPGDAAYYHYGANLLADGQGFIDPQAFLNYHLKLPAAVHPPAFLVAMTGSSVLGLRSVLAHQILCCVLGAITVGVIGLAGREIAGSRTGIVAAVLAAAYPNFWLNDTVVMSETLVQLVVALTILAAFRFWRVPTITRAVVLGAALGVTILTRAETVFAVPLIIVPLLLARPQTARRRLALGSVATATTLLLLVP